MVDAPHAAPSLTSHTARRTLQTRPSHRPRAKGAPPPQSLHLMNRPGFYWTTYYGADPDAVQRRIDELGDRMDTTSVIDDHPNEK